VIYEKILSYVSSYSDKGLHDFEKIYEMAFLKLSC